MAKLLTHIQANRRKEPMQSTRESRTHHFQKDSSGRKQMVKDRRRFPVLMTKIKKLRPHTRWDI